MPVYDYKCREHGLFNKLATLAESAEPAACPVCSKPAPRIIMLPPELLARNQSRNSADGRNERSRHEPLFSTPEARQEAQARREHQHGKGCGCGHQPLGKSKLFYTADGKKMFPSMRPWMISH